MPQAGGKLKLTLLSFFIIIFVISTGILAVADDNVDGAEERFVSPNSLGGIGLLQTRTARFGPDGLFHFGYSRVEPYRRVYITVHVLPWVEGTFRYTEIRDQLYSVFPWFSGYQSYKDRGADLKFRLLKETKYLPALAVGFQDGLGTGVFTSEYLVGSKMIGDFDFSIGVGWGYLGSKGSIKNPLISLNESFSSRTGKGAQGGTVILDSFFSGKTVGLFGGFEYRTPIEGLTFKFEYDGHNYDLENARPLSKSSDYNFGLNFRPYPWIDISLGKERGERTMLRISLRAELHEKGITKFDLPPPKVESRPTINSLVSGISKEIIPEIVSSSKSAPIITNDNLDSGSKIFSLLDDQRIILESFSIVDNEALIEVSDPNNNSDYLTLAYSLLEVLSEDISSVIIVPRNLVPLKEYRAERQTGNIKSIDKFYDYLFKLGINLENIEINGERGFISVQAINPVDEILFSDLASITISELSINEVSIFDLGTGRTEIWKESRGEVISIFSSSDDFSLPLPPLDPPYTEQQKLKIVKDLALALESEGFYLETFSLESRSATISFAGAKYPSETRNIGFATRIIINFLPAPIEEITIIRLNGGMEVSRLTFLRSDVEREFLGKGSIDEFFARTKIEPGYPGWPEFKSRMPGRYPRFKLSLGPQIRQHLGGPDQFYLYQIWMAGDMGIDIGRGLSISSRFGYNLYHNFDKIKLTSYSLLPHVRSDIKNYLQQGASNIVNLQADLFFKINKSIYSRISAGLFEEMYGGFGAELLYRPFSSRLALSVEWNRVRKRTFEQRFNFFQYEVDTGHIGLYYEEPKYNLLTNIRIARYLAGDKGVTFELSRLFDSGIRIGAWATLTDVPFAMFGEGSFDKGFFIVIPFDLFTTKSTSSTGVFAFRPLYRDGGMLLIKNKRLYDMTVPASLKTVTKDWQQIFK